MTHRQSVFVIGLVTVLLVASIGIRARWSDQREHGYVAFNSREYQVAKSHLSVIAKLGDSKAQQLMSYMYGLGLGQPVDFSEAMHWMRMRASSDKDSNSVGEQAYYLGVAALDGLYGEDKKELGIVWLEIAKYSGVIKARGKLEQAGRKQENEK